MPDYSHARYGVTQRIRMPGDGGTSLLLSPAGTATAAGTTTNTIAGKNVGFGIPVKIKQIVYTIFSAQTGAGDNVTLQLFTGTGATAVGQLAITTQLASSVNTSSVLNVQIPANTPIRIDAVAVQTASGEKAAYGYLDVTYQEAFDNIDR